MKKVLCAFLLVIAMLLTGCSSATDDAGNVKDPTDLIDVVDPVDLQEGIDGAAALSVGVLLNGEFNEDGEAYLLDIYTASFYSITSMGDLDLDGILSTVTGQFISYNDDISDIDYNFKILVYLEPGTYLVGVTASEDTTSGTYQLLVEATTVVHVSEIAMNSMISDDIFNGVTNTVEFIVPSDGDVQLYTDSFFDTYGAIYDSNGDIVAENDDGENGDDFYIDVFLESGTYFIEISGAGEYDVGNYELFYDFIQDEIVYITVGLDSFVASSVERHGAEYFELTITEAVTVNIYSEGNYDLEGDIYVSKSATYPFEYNDDGGEGYNFLFDNLYLEPGVYYIRVSSLDYTLADYELHVDTVEETPAAGDGDDFTIDLNTTASKTLSTGGIDVYTIVVATEGELMVYLFSEFNSYGIIYDADGDIIAEDDNGPAGSYDEDFVIEIAALSAGTYTIEVKGLDRSEYGDYTLFVIFEAS